MMFNVIFSESHFIIANLSLYVLPLSFTFCLPLTILFLLLVASIEQDLNF